LPGEGFISAYGAISAGPTQEQLIESRTSHEPKARRTGDPLSRAGWEGWDARPGLSMDQFGPGWKKGQPSCTLLVRYMFGISDRRRGLL
jgi:hypothetical protein